MRRFIVITAGLGLLVGTSALLAGCESTGGNGKHEMAAQEDGHAIGCQMCYDEAVRVRKLGVRGGNWTRNQVIREHMCPDCKVEMSSYTKDGVPMIKCAKCAPEGVPCSTCEPPKAK